MCGIAGAVYRNPDHRTGSVDRMMGAFVHRGPDGAGSYSNASLRLGMRRLSIIDLAGGDQPLYNEDRSIVLIANGEIYNYVELRRQLIDRGHRFASQSDCEVILHLYEDYQAGCLDWLRGMFAFALWDEKRGTLLMARDRMGEKPLYLSQTADSLLFSSEMKSLLSTGEVEFRLDPVAIDRYFHYGYVPEPLTPLEGVRKLPAGHYLMVRPATWEFEETCYWRLEDAPPLDGNPAELIRQELETIGELIVRADVPVGVALSGGLDSSLVAALASRKYAGAITAFSVGYEGGSRHDERALARQFADHLAIPFHDVVLKTDEVVSGFPELVWWQDDPIADIAGSGYLAVMRLAREHGVPVMLQGHGGDELFWGYRWAREAVRQTIRKWQLLEARQGVAGRLALWPYLRPSLPRPSSPVGWLKWFLDAGGLRSSFEELARDLNRPPDQLVFYDLSPDYRQAGREAGSLYTASFRQALGGRSPAEIFTISAAERRPFDQAGLEVAITGLLCGTYLIENGVAQGDRLSMASSVELRLPLIDYRLVETVIGLRKSAPDSANGPKAWLKAAMRGIIPEWVLNRPKRGFTPPVRDWHGALFAAYGQRLRDGYLVGQGVLDPAAASRLSQGPFPLGVTAPLSFKALVLEQWCRNFVE